MLDKRLQTIFDLLNEGMVVADIGTDHAFLPIELINSNKAKHVYACDVALGPLNIAKENIKQYGLSDKITTIKTDGIKDVPSECEAIVIAGMGYHTAKQILLDSYDKLKDYKQIIVQINNDVELLRQWISDNNFTIENERMVKVKHFYTIIEFNTKYHEKYDEDSIMFGPKLLESKNKVFIEYLNYKLDKYNEILKQVTDIKKIELLKNNVNKIKQAINQCTLIK